MAIGACFLCAEIECHCEGQSCLPHGSQGRGKRKNKQKTGNTRDPLTLGCKGVGCLLPMQETLDQEFKVILNNVVGSRPAWDL